MREDSYPQVEPGLYVVATPIGNLSDLGRRACDILRHVDLIAAEDTRVTRVLLESIDAHVPMVSTHAHNEHAATKRILAHLARGERVALVSDAGSPGISDPGAIVVAAARAAGHCVVPIPGPSAVTTLLSVSGFGDGSYCFVGFVPSRKSARERFLIELRDSPRTSVFFETPHRIEATLAAISQTCEADRRLLVGRELTKRFEEIAELRAADAPAWLAGEANRRRGEFVLALAPAVRVKTAADDHPRVSVDALLAGLIADLGVNRAVRLAHALTALPRRELYARALALGAPGDLDDDAHD